MSVIGIALIIVVVIFVVSTLNIACFFLGARVVQKVVKDEPLKMSTLNPLQKYREHQKEKEFKRQQEINRILMENIENFDGTERGQQEIPRY